MIQLSRGQIKLIRVGKITQILYPVFKNELFPYGKVGNDLFLEVGNALEPPLHLKIKDIFVKKLHDIRFTDHILGINCDLEEYWRKNWNISGVKWDDNPSVWCIDIYAPKYWAQKDSSK